MKEIGQTSNSDVGETNLQGKRVVMVCYCHIHISSKLCMNHKINDNAERQPHLLILHEKLNNSIIGLKGIKWHKKVSVIRILDRN